jgi:hypothetical protein
LLLGWQRKCATKFWLRLHLRMLWKPGRQGLRRSWWQRTLGLANGIGCGLHRPGFSGPWEVPRFFRHSVIYLPQCSPKSRCSLSSSAEALCSFRRTPSRLVLSPFLLSNLFYLSPCLSRLSRLDRLCFPLCSISFLNLQRTHVYPSPDNLGHGDEKFENAHETYRMCLGTDYGTVSVALWVLNM